MKVFLTGRPGSGKSTVLMRVIDRLKAEGRRVGGITTPEVRVGGRRVAFKVVDLSSGREGVLASVDCLMGPRVGRYRVDIPDFERVALPALDFALEECDFICVDELGTMEFFSEAFKEKVREALKSEKSLIAVVHWNYARFYGKVGILIEVTPENRETIAETITQKILGKPGETKQRKLGESSTKAKNDKP